MQFLISVIFWRKRKKRWNSAFLIIARSSFSSWILKFLSLSSAFGQAVQLPWQLQHEQQKSTSIDLFVCFVICIYNALHCSRKWSIFLLECQVNCASVALAATWSGNLWNTWLFEPVLTIKLINDHSCWR